MATITELSIHIATEGTDARNSMDGVNLQIGYYSSHGRAPLTTTVALHPAKEAIGAKLEKVLDSAKLPDDIGVIHTLQIVPTPYGNLRWSMSEVVRVAVEDSDGNGETLVANLGLHGDDGAQTIYEQDPPGEGVHGLVFDVNESDSQKLAIPGLKSGQVLTISIDPSQEWMMDGQIRSNCNGPLIPVEDPYFSMKLSKNYLGRFHVGDGYKRDWEFVRGCFVLHYEYAKNSGASYRWAHTSTIGDYLRVSLLTEVSYGLYIKLWGGNAGKDTGKIGIRYEVHDANYEEERASAAGVPKEATSHEVYPQQHNLANPIELYDTKIEVEIGDMLHVRCDPYDTWSLKPGNELNTNANGVFSPIAQGSNAKAAQIGDWWFSRGCLLGTLDDGETYFPIGTWLDSRMQHAGTLKLACFDDSASDDTGSITAKVWTTKGGWDPSAGISSELGDPGDLDITVHATTNNMYEDYIQLSNNTNRLISLDDMLLFVPSSIGKSKNYHVFFEFPDGTELPPNEDLKVYSAKKDKSFVYQFHTEHKQLFTQYPNKVLLLAKVEEVDA